MLHADLCKHGSLVVQTGQPQTATLNRAMLNGTGDTPVIN